MTIEVGQVWITRGGQTARILSTDRKHHAFPIVAVVLTGSDIEAIKEYTECGRYYKHTDQESAFDLIKLAPKKVKIERWICIFKNSGGVIFTMIVNTEADAREYLSDIDFGVIDIVPFTHEVEIEE